MKERGVGRGGDKAVKGGGGRERSKAGREGGENVQKAEEWEGLRERRGGGEGQRERT